MMTGTQISGVEVDNGLPRLRIEAFAQGPTCQAGTVPGAHSKSV